MSNDDPHPYYSADAVAICLFSLSPIRPVAAHEDEAPRSRSRQVSAATDETLSQAIQGQEAHLHGLRQRLRLSLTAPATFNQRTAV